MAKASADSDFGFAPNTSRDESFEPPTRVSTTTSASVISSDTETMGIGGRFASMYRRGSRLTLEQDEIKGGQDFGCFIEILSETKGPQFDLVFVHGITGDYRTTWNCGDVFWPQAIASDVPSARVLLFGYNTEVWNSEKFTNVEQTANYMSLLLSKARMEEMSGRSIIWIAHSVGGFLVKAICASENELYNSSSSDLQVSMSLRHFTVGIIFMGTPHRVLSLGGWTPILRRISAVAEEYNDVVLTKHWVEQPDTSLLIQLLNRFEESIQTSDTRIYSFYEQHETNGESLPVLVTSLENAMFNRSESRDCLPGNHVTMCQLQGPGDKIYMRIKRIIEEIPMEPRPILSQRTTSNPTIPLSLMEFKVVANLRGAIGFKNETSQYSGGDGGTFIPPSVIPQFAATFKLRRLKRHLAFPNYHVSARFKPNSEKSLSMINLTEWVTNTSEFQKWSTLGQILVLYWPIGSGKSELAARIAQQLDESYSTQALDDDPQTYVLSYFFDNLIESEYAMTQMLHQFLLQLLEISPVLVRHFPTKWVFDRPMASWPEWDKEGQVPYIRTKSSSHDSNHSLPDEDSEFGMDNLQFVRKSFSMMELIEILISILHDDQVYKAVFVIDGIDYCQQKCLSQLLYFIGILNSLSLRKTRICLTYHSRLDISMRRMLCLDIGQGITDVNWQASIVTDTLYSSIALETVQTPLLKERFQEISEKLSTQRGQYYLSIRCIQRILNSLRHPVLSHKFVEFLAQDWLKKGEGEKERINKIYDWIITHALPENSAGLDLVGLLFLIAMVSHPLTTNEAIQLHPAFRRVIQTREHINSVLWESNAKLDIEKPSELESLIHTIEDQTYGLLRLDNGIIYIWHPSLKTFILDLLQHHHLRAVYEFHLGLQCLQLMHELRQPNPPQVEAYYYSFAYWSTHLVASHEDQSWDTAKSSQVLDILKDLWDDNNIRYNMHKFSRANFPVRCDFSLSALLAGYGLYKVIDLYVENGSDCLSTNYLTLEQKCALANSSEQCNIVLTKRKRNDALQDSDSHPDAHTADMFRTWAKSQHFRDHFFLPYWSSNIFSQLNISSSENQGEISQWNEFSSKVRSPGNTRLIKCLETNGVLNQFLALSVRQADNILCKALLERGADPNYVQDNDSRKPTVLHLAASTGSSRLVKTLLVYGGRRSVTDEVGTRPIHWAAERGHFEVVQLLVSPSADLDNKKKRNPLFMACSSGSSQTVKVLLEFGSNINLKDISGFTPLHAAAAIGSFDLVRLLLSRGASPKTQDRKGICPLHLGAFGGWVNVVDELLAHGVPVDVQNKSNQTALHFACKSLNPSMEVVSTLLQQQADPNAKDIKNNTPLQIAISGGKRDVVELLLKAMGLNAAPLLRNHGFHGSNTSVQNLIQEHRSNRPFNSLTNLETKGDPAAGPIVNVVFVHGFHRTQQDTWSKESSTFWPKDILHADIPNTNLIFWDYCYESADFSKLTLTQHLAKSLLQQVLWKTSSAGPDLLNSKSNPYSQMSFKAPIVFVGHSLGGLLIKLALQIASEQDEFSSVLVNTKGIVLIGTPQYVMEEDLYIKTLNQLVLAATENILGLTFRRRCRPLNEILPLLTRDIDKHGILEAKFTNICEDKEIVLLSIMEGYISSGTEPLVPSRVARYDLPQSRNQVSRHDHADLGRITDREDVMYREIHRLIQDIVLELDETSPPKNYITEKPLPILDIAPPSTEASFVNGQGKMVASKLADSILSHLHASQSQTNRAFDPKSEIVALSLLPSTNPQDSDKPHPVNSWLHSQDPKTLWISGKPGSGKSALMKALFRHKLTLDFLQDSFEVSKSHLVLSAFHFSTGMKHRQSAEDMVRSLLYQIFSEKRQLISNVTSEINEGDGITPDFLSSWEMLVSTFQNAVELDRSLKYIIFIDGLDECRPSNEDTDPQKKLHQFILECNLQPNLKLCISSRPLNVFMQNFSDAEPVYVDQANFSDIKFSVHERLSKVGSQYGLDTGHLISKITEKSQGMALWATLAVENTIHGIENGDSNSQLEQSLDTIPTRLHDIYHRMLLEIPKGYIQEASRIFRLVLTAPCKKVDISLLVLAEEDYKEDYKEGSGSQKETSRSNLRAIIEPLRMYQNNSKSQPSGSGSRMKWRIKSRCSDFLEVEKSGEVRFIHHTAEAFISKVLQDFRGWKAIQDPDLIPLLNLLSASIIILKRVVPTDPSGSKHQSTRRYISNALEIALLIDSNGRDPESYVQLVDELSYTCQTLYKSIYDLDQNELEKLDKNNFESESRGQYTSLLAIRLGLWNYLDQTVTQIGADLADSSGRSFLLHAINRQDLKSLPWVDTRPDNWDLPPIKVVKSLLRRGCDPNEKFKSRDLWKEVLEAGYHCFSDKWIPETPGPSQTIRNRDIWVDLMGLFIKYGVNRAAKYEITWVRRHFSGSSSVSKHVLEITPRKTIFDNLKYQRLYEPRLRELNELIGESSSSPNELKQNMSDKSLSSNHSIIMPQGRSNTTPLQGNTDEDVSKHHIGLFRKVQNQFRPSSFNSKVSKKFQR